MSERSKFIAAVILVILGGLAAIAGASLVFYWFGLPPRRATLAGALLVSAFCKLAEIVYQLSRIGGAK